MTLNEAGVYSRTKVLECQGAIEEQPERFLGLTALTWHLAQNVEDGLVLPVAAESHHKPHATLGNFLWCKALACSL